MEKREYWLRMAEHGGEYEISNLGRVRKYYWSRRNRTGNETRTRIIKLRDDKKKKCIYWQGGRNGEVWDTPIAHLVYKYFGEGMPDESERKVHVLHADEDYRNNEIDNLYIARPTTDRVAGWQVDKYNREAERNIRLIVSKAKHYYDKKLGIDPEEVIQEALIMAWENLAKLAPDEPFYNYAMKYTKYAYYRIRQQTIDIMGIYKV